MSNSNRFNRKRFALGTVLVVACAAAAVTAFDKRREVATESFAGSSAEVHSILAALPIELTEPFTHDWSAERAPVQSGWLLALEVEPEMLVPHQVADPVLYVGDQAVERINQGDQSGRVIVIVPKRIDLSSAPIFFGTAALPESVTAATRSSELSQARKDGARAFSAPALKTAYEQGLSGSDTEVVEFADRRQLLDFAAQWIFEYSPEESDFASQLLRIPTGK